MRLKNILILAMTATLLSCGGKKNLLSGTKDLSMKKVIKAHENAVPDFKTLRGKLRTGYSTKDQSQSITISVRMEKDRAIWLSAKLAGIIPLAKAMISPDKVEYYAKINKTYFSGDFALLSKWLGTKLDFEKVQNLLTGQTIYELNDDEYHLEESSSGYQFRSEEEAILSKLFLLDPVSFRTKAQQLVRKSENQSVTVTYLEYQNMDGFYFPGKISIIANQSGESTKIDLEYRSLEFDVPVNFPFDIPSGYKEIIVE